MTETDEQSEDKRREDIRAKAIEAADEVLAVGLPALWTKLDQFALNPAPADYFRCAREGQGLVQELKPLLPSMTSEMLLREARDRCHELKAALHAARDAKAEQLATGNQSQWPALHQRMATLFREHQVKENKVPSWAAHVRAMVSFARSTALSSAELQEHASNIRMYATQALEAKETIAKVLGEVETAPERWTSLTFAKEFQRSALVHTVMAVVFFLAAIGAFAYGIDVLLHTTIQPEYDKDGRAMLDAVFATRLISRGIAVSLVSTLGFILLKSYRANSHLAVTNGHRAKVLKTYTTLVDAGTDTETRTMLLRAAADTIFQGGQTGYLGDKEFRIDEQIVSLLRDTVSKKAGGA